MIVLAIIPILLLYRSSIPQEDPGRIPAIAPRQLQDHRRVQRKYPGRARGQRRSGREDENLKEFQGLTANMYKAPTGQPGSRLSSCRRCRSSLPLPWASSSGTAGMQSETGFIDHRRHPGLRLVPDLHDVAGPGPGPRLCRDAALDRLGGAIFKLIDTPPEVQNRPDAIPAQTLLGEIEFDHVDFYYEDRKPVLTDFTLKVKPGETIALVGPTGGGKSTIVNLLCRFYEPREGIDPDQRARLHGLHAALDPLPDRDRAPDAASVLGHRPREHPLWTTGGHR